MLGYWFYATSQTPVYLRVFQECLALAYLPYSLEKFNYTIPFHPHFQRTKGFLLLREWSLLLSENLWHRCFDYRGSLRHTTEILFHIQRPYKAKQTHTAPKSLFLIARGRADTCNV